MADDRENLQSQQRTSDPVRMGRGGGGRDQGSREPGGFRIRLSDNEMRAARALQDAFRLRSTVAVLGFALRTTAQLLDDGKLDALVEQQRSQAPERTDGSRGSDGPRGMGGGRRDGRSEGRGDGRSDRAPRVDPFARPSRPPQPQPVVTEPAQPEEQSLDAESAETPRTEIQIAETQSAEIVTPDAGAAESPTDPSAQPGASEA